MNITATTSTESITRPVLVARARLAEKSVEFSTESQESPEEFYLRGEALVEAAVNVQVAEALMQAQLRYRDVLINTDDTAKRLQMLLTIANGDPDDKWSGRNNDVKRSARDAIRTWVNDQVWTFRD